MKKNKITDCCYLKKKEQIYLSLAECLTLMPYLICLTITAFEGRPRFKFSSLHANE